MMATKRVRRALESERVFEPEREPKYNIGLKVSLRLLPGGLVVGPPASNKGKKNCTESKCCWREREIRIRLSRRRRRVGINVCKAKSTPFLPQRYGASEVNRQEFYRPD